MTELKLWFQLCTCSRRAIKRSKGRFGHPYTYRPRGDLLARLAKQNGMTVDQVYRQLLKERETLINHIEL
jgi:hypothetical protein